MKAKFKRFSSCAHILQKVTIGSACYNLFTAKTVLLEPNAMRSLETDIGFCFSKKYVAKIYPRSSLSLRSVFAGGGRNDLFWFQGKHTCYTEETYMLYWAVFQVPGLRLTSGTG